MAGGGLVPGDGGEGRVVAAGPAGGVVRGLEGGPYAAGEAIRLLAAGERVVAVAGAATWLLDPATGEWIPGAAPPSEPAPFEGVAAGGGELVLWLDDDDPHAYDLADDSWRQIRKPPRLVGAAAGAGLEYVWTGDAALAAGRAYDPVADRWTSTVRLPLEDGDVIADPYVGWTGEALVVFGGARYLCPVDAGCDLGPVPETLSGWIYLS